MRVLLFFLAAAVFTGRAEFRGGLFRGVSAKRGTVERYGCFELGVRLDSVYRNPYDYSEIALRCVFTGPGGRVDTVDGFYMRDSRLDTLTGKVWMAGGHFAVRYAPAAAGRWTYRLFCVRAGKTVWGPRGSFECRGGGDPGFLRVNGSPYLSYSNGSSFIPIGENLGWAQKNAYLDYKRWVGRLSDHGGNFIRVWMPAWGLGLEWKKGYMGYEGIGRYQQSNAALLDWLLSYCEEKQVYVMLSLDHHGQVSTKVNPNWGDNPYNRVNGGPCAHTWDFFSDTAARRSIRNRFRYIVARWGYSDRILAWELFNEVDWTDEFRKRHAVVAQWHGDMADWIRSLDVNHHLVTTSFGDARWDSLAWRLPALDFTQTHYYTSRSLDSVLSIGTARYLAAFRKPTLTGEFGLTVDDRGLAAADPTGTYIHNALWATLMSGAMGTGLPWYWDNYIDGRDLYGCFDGVAKFAGHLDLMGMGYRPAAMDAGGGTGPVRSYVLRSRDSTRLAGWLLNPGTGSAVGGVVLRATGMRDGNYVVHWWDCDSGVVSGSGRVDITGGVLRLSCPVIYRDKAMTVEMLNELPSGTLKGSGHTGE